MTPVAQSALLALPGIGLALHAVRQRRRGLLASSWPVAPGVVGSGSIREVGLGDILRFRPYLTYTYCVNGTWYLGDRIRFGATPESFLPWVAGWWLDRHYPKGRAVQVAYNPADPADAVLQPGVPVWTSTLLVLAVLLGLGGALIPLVLVP